MHTNYQGSGYIINFNQTCINAVGGCPAAAAEEEEEQKPHFGCTKMK
jgi:hypothetical protein